MKTYPMVSFRCDNQFRRELEREAKRRNISIGELIRQAITNHINPSEPPLCTRHNPPQLMQQGETNAEGNNPSR